MTFYSMEIKVPREMRDALEKLAKETQRKVEAYQVCEAHRELYDDKWDNHVLPDHPMPPEYWSWQREDQYLRRLYNAQLLVFMNAAHDVAIWWRRVSPETSDSGTK